MRGGAKETFRTRWNEFTVELSRIEDDPVAEADALAEVVVD